MLIRLVYSIKVFTHSVRKCGKEHQLLEGVIDVISTPGSLSPLPSSPYEPGVGVTNERNEMRRRKSK